MAASFHKFILNHNNRQIAADICTSRDSSRLPPRILCLHGGGPNTGRGRFDRLRIELSNRNVETCAFDFIGHGDSGGELRSTSLRDRTEQAALLIEKRMARPLVLLAASMGGYTAIKLLEGQPISGLILFAPAVYASEAYNIKFGPDFSTIIRQQGSWANSDAWQILSGFKGKVFIVAAEKDAVVPKEVINKIYTSCLNASYRELFTIKEGTHKIFDYIYNDQRAMRIIVEKILRVTEAREITGQF